MSPPWIPQKNKDKEKTFYPHSILQSANRNLQSLKRWGTFLSLFFLLNPLSLPQAQAQARELWGSSQFSKSRYVLGVVLPLSGIHQPFGERVLRGIRLAIKERDFLEKGFLFSLAIRDSKGSPRVAEKAVEELATKEKVIAIIGPLLREFRNTYRHEPQTLEALAYDGTKLLMEVLLPKSISSPVQLKDELRQVRNFQGVSGLKRFGEDGKTIRTFSILTVKNSQIEQVLSEGDSGLD